jgi:hypothetical protein
VLNIVARDMDCCVCRLPEASSGQALTDAAADALAETARAVASCMDKEHKKDEVFQSLQRSIEKLVYLQKII